MPKFTIKTPFVVSSLNQNLAWVEKDKQLRVFEVSDSDYLN